MADARAQHPDDVVLGRIQGSLLEEDGDLVGALAVREDQLIITEMFLLRDADDDEVRLSIEYLARTADTHEKHIYGTDKY